MAWNSKLDLDQSGKPISKKVYRGMITLLLYLTSRLNVIFSVWLCLHFQSALRKSHVTIVRNFFRYLIITKMIGL